MYSSYTCLFWSIELRTMLVTPMCYLQQPADICYFVYFVVNVHVLLLKLLGNRPKASIAFSYSNTPDVQITCAREKWHMC